MKVSSTGLAVSRNRGLPHAIGLGKRGHEILELIGRTREEATVVVLRDSRAAPSGRHLVSGHARSHVLQLRQVDCSVTVGAVGNLGLVARSEVVTTPLDNGRA